MKADAIVIGTIIGLMIAVMFLQHQRLGVLEAQMVYVSSRLGELEREEAKRKGDNALNNGARGQDKPPDGAGLQHGKGSPLDAHGKQREGYTG